MTCIRYWEGEWCMEVKCLLIEVSMVESCNIIQCPPSWTWRVGIVPGEYLALVQPGQWDFVCPFQDATVFGIRQFLFDECKVCEVVENVIALLVSAEEWRVIYSFTLNTDSAIILNWIAFRWFKGLNVQREVVCPSTLIYSWFQHNLVIFRLMPEERWELFRLILHCIEPHRCELPSISVNQGWKSVFLDCPTSNWDCLNRCIVISPNLREGCFKKQHT